MKSSEAYQENMFVENLKFFQCFSTFIDYDYAIVNCVLLKNAVVLVLQVLN